jgi:peptidoglycan/LPS O-acetylase OafA/YrhL
LDGVRAIAILLVLLGHHLEAAPVEWVSRLAVDGWVGVDLFFVLSGFLIGGILLDQREAPNLFRVFYARRFFRIVPLYALLVLPGLAVTGLGLQRWFAGHSLGHDSGAGLWFSLFFVQNIGCVLGVGLPQYLGPTWSVAVEEQFYLLLPWLVRWLAPRRLPWVLLGLILLAPMLRLGCWFSGLPNAPLGCYVLLPCRWDALLLGVMGAWAYRSPRFQSWFRHHSGRMRIGAAVTGLLSLAVLLPSHSRIDPAMALGGYTVIDLCFVLLLLLGVMSEGGSWRGFLSHGAFKPVALVSYGLYLLQSPAQAITESVVHRYKHDYPAHSWTALAVALLGLGLTVVMAAVSWCVFERPMLKLGHRWRYRRIEPPVK